MTSYDELLARYRMSIGEAEGITLDFYEFKKDLLIEIGRYTFLAQGGAREACNSGDQVEFSGRVNPRIEEFNRQVRLLIATYELHTRPHVPGARFEDEAHIHTCCSHLRDTYHAAPTAHFPYIEAHVYSSTPRERLCLACARHRKRIHTHDCTLCAGDDDHPYSSLYRKRAIQITSFREPPVTFHIPVCQRCRTILAEEFRLPGIGPPQ